MSSMHFTTGEYKLIDDLSADIDRSTSEQQIGSDFLVVSNNRWLSFDSLLWYQKGLWKITVDECCLPMTSVSIWAYTLCGKWTLLILDVCKERCLSALVKLPIMYACNTLNSLFNISKKPLAKQTIRCGVVPLKKSDRCDNNPDIAISDWNPVHNYLNKFNKKNIFFESLKVEYSQGFFYLRPSSELKRMTSQRTLSLNRWGYTHKQTTYKF